MTAPHDGARGDKRKEHEAPRCTVCGNSVPVEPVSAERIAAVLAEHEPAEWREVRPETYPGAHDARYGRFCSCGQMLDASDMDRSVRAHAAAALAAALGDRR